MRSALPLASLFLLLGGCVAIDDYSKFSFDGSAPPTDARVDGGGPDASDGGSDTGTMPLGMCDSPCLTDAYLDFSTEQGTGTLAWRYQGQTFADPLEYFDLVPGSDPDSWAATPAPPSIARCPDAASLCTAPGLLLEAGADTGPVLVTTVEATGRYSVDLSAEPIGAAPTELWVSRNAAPDLVGRLVVDPMGGPTTATAAFEAVAGDRIVVALRNPTGASDARVAANVRLSTTASPSRCEHVATFDGDLDDACGGEPYAADGSGTLPALAPGPAPYLGMAQGLVSGSSTGVGLIAMDANVDRSGDFTTQLWVRTTRQDYVTSSIYQDWDGTSSAGINFSMEDPSGADQVEVNFLYRDATNTEHPGVTCTSGDCSGVLSFPRPADGRWYHLRLTRSAGDESIRVCVDGFEVASTQVPAAADLTNPLSPKVGFNFGGTPTYRFDGLVDDIRQYSEAFPCAPSP